MSFEQMKHQGKILTDRYLDCVLGEFQTTILLIGQAPLIAALIAWRFHDVTPTKFLYFSLALSTLWFGCTNAAREVVKEQAIFSRERLFFLHIGAYLLSKFKILSILAFIQSLLFILIVNYFVALKGFILFHIVTAFLTTLSGVALGLAISSLVKSVHQADAIVPIVLIPQILFSPIVMPESFLKGFATYFEKAMMLRWSYYAFTELVSKDFKIMVFFQNILVLLVIIALLMLVSGIMLKNKEIVY